MVEEVEPPRGREAVVEALVEAATSLFAQRGPAAVSLRDVAEAAGVNLGLIHRYIGSKEDLLTTVLARRRREDTFTGDPEEYVLQFLTRDPGERLHLRVLMRAALDGYDVRRLEPDAPNVKGFARLLGSSMDQLDADVRTALAVAVIFGWTAMGPTALAMLGRRRINEAA